MDSSQIEPLITLSTSSLQTSTLSWMRAGGQGEVLYPNEYGAFMYVGYPEQPDFDAAVPEEISRLARWAWRQSIMWIKFDPDGAAIDGDWLSEFA